MGLGIICWGAAFAYGFSKTNIDDFVELRELIKQEETVGWYEMGAGWIKADDIRCYYGYLDKMRALRSLKNRIKND